MANLFGNIVNYIFGLLGVVMVAGISARLMYVHFTTEKQETAVVVNKQSYDRRVFGKNHTTLKKEYVITFQCGSKIRHFNVSELSYGNYMINRKGVLTYKGSCLIDFK